MQHSDAEEGTPPPDGNTQPPVDPSSEETDDALVCSRDNTTVDAENIRCLHPSSRCDFRELCPIVWAVRKRKKA